VFAPSPNPCIFTLFFISTFHIVQEFRNRSTLIRYWTDAKRSALSLQLIPLSRLDDVVAHRPNYVGTHELEMLPWGNTSGRNPAKPEPMVHAKLRGQEYSAGYLHGSSMKLAPALAEL